MPDGCSRERATDPGPATIWHETAGHGHRASMSEYQYYEFQTADRRLSEKEMQELRSYSTRAVITPTSFSNEYSFGSFKGNPAALMEKYFDGFVYLANWGTLEFQLALPAKLLSAETARLYCSGRAASVRENSGKVILTFLSQAEPGREWVQGQGALSSLLPLRTELARGDLRALYIGWLLNVQTGRMDNGSVEPPVPPSLDQLSSPLSSLVDFLRIDPDLLAVAAEASPRTQTRSVQPGEMAAWVAQLPSKEKNELLVRLMAGEDAALGAELRCRFDRTRADTSPPSERPRRTVGRLLAAAEAFRSKRQREEARRAAEAKERQERLAAIARQKASGRPQGPRAEVVDRSRATRCHQTGQELRSGGTRLCGFAGSGRPGRGRGGVFPAFGSTTRGPCP